MIVWATSAVDELGHDGFGESVYALNQTLEGALAGWVESHSEQAYIDREMDPLPDLNHAWIVDGHTWEWVGRAWEKGLATIDIKIEPMSVGA